MRRPETENKSGETPALVVYRVVRTSTVLDRALGIIALCTWQSVPLTRGANQ